MPDRDVLPAVAERAGGRHFASPRKSAHRAEG